MSRQRVRLPRLHESPELLNLFSPSAEESRAEIEFYAEAIKRARRSDGRCRVLELGVGTGRVFFGLARDGVELTGLDRNEAFLALCRERAERLGAAASFELGDMARYPPRPAADAILCPCGTMSLLRRPDKLRAFFASAAGRVERGGAFAAELWVAAEPPARLSRRDSENWIADDRARAVLDLLGPTEEGLPLRVQTRISSVPGEPWLFRVESRALGADGSPLCADVETGRVWEPRTLRLAIAETAQAAGKRAEASLHPCYDLNALLPDDVLLERAMLVVDYR